MITPKLIIELIKEVYDINVAEDNKRGRVANLRNMYYYLCIKYCNPTIYTYSEIAKEVNRKHCTINNMLIKISDRLNTKGWEEHNEILINLDNIIEEKYNETKDVVEHKNLDDFDTLKLKRRIKYLEKLNYNRNLKIMSLNRQLK